MSEAVKSKYMDQAGLNRLGVKQKIIDTLFDIFGSSIPKVPSILMLDDGESYLSPNAFYALTILVAQGKRPSATAAYKIAGGKASNFYSDAGKIIELLPDQFKKKKVDAALSPMGVVKQELLVAEEALFNAELADQERQATKLLTEQADKYESQIKALELKLAEVTGSQQELLRLSVDHTRTIEHLQKELQSSLVSSQKLTQAQELAAERKEQVKELNERAKRDYIAYQEERKASAKIINDLSEDIEHSESLVQQARTSESSMQEALLKALDEKDDLVVKVAELTNKLKQSELLLQKENETSVLIENITSSMEPLNQLASMIEVLSSTDKKREKEVKAILASMSDLSSNLLSYQSAIKKSNK